MEGQMKRLTKAISMAGIAALLRVAPAWGADDEAQATVEEMQTLVVPPAPFDPVIVGWYEISALGGVPQEAVAYDQAGEELMRETNPAVSGRVSDWWCALFSLPVASGAVRVRAAPILSAPALTRNGQIANARSSGIHCGAELQPVGARLTGRTILPSSARLPSCVAYRDWKTRAEPSGWPRRCGCPVAAR
jgi:hypothetical protein